MQVGHAFQAVAEKLQVLLMMVAFAGAAAAVIPGKARTVSVVMRIGGLRAIPSPDRGGSSINLF